MNPILQAPYTTSYFTWTRRHVALYPYQLLESPRVVQQYTTGSDPETIDTGTIPIRYESILTNKTLLLGGDHRIAFNMDRDMLWHWDRVLKAHSNGMRFSCFGEEGELLATNEYFSVGGGFVVNDQTKGLPTLRVQDSPPLLKICYIPPLPVDENLFYKGVDKRTVHEARLHQNHSISDPLDASESEKTDSDRTSAAHSDPHPPYPFSSGDTLLALTKKHNVRDTSVVVSPTDMMEIR